MKPYEAHGRDELSARLLGLCAVRPRTLKMMAQTLGVCSGSVSKAMHRMMERGFVVKHLGGPAPIFRSGDREPWFYQTTPAGASWAREVNGRRAGSHAETAAAAPV